MAQTPRTTGTIPLPRAYLEAPKALDLVGRCSGQRYVVTALALDGLVGPFKTGQTIGAKELLARVAEATDTELTASGDVAVLQPRGTDKLKQALSDVVSEDPARRRCAAFELGEALRLEAVSPLVQALADDDRSVRRAALLALNSFEGDFAVNQWAGRSSVFELPGVELDVDLLMWLVEDGADPGSREWLAAVSILGRARCGELSRSAWWNIYARRQGTIRATIRALGRCGDRDMRNPLESHLKNVSTNVEADRFEAAAALGKIGEIRRLAGCDPEGTAAEVRCAAAYGLGFCGTADSLEALKQMLADPDPRVAELAALSLGRHDSDESIRLLGGTLSNEHAPGAVRTAAANALARSTRSGAQDALVNEARSAEPATAAAAAEALGAVGGPAAVQALIPLLESEDRNIAAAAARSLASLGPTDASDTLASRLKDPKADLETRIAVAIGLGQGRAPEAAGPLSEVALDGNADLRLRQYAARSLAMLADRAGQQTLRMFLEGEPPLQLRLLALRHLDLGDADETVGVLTWWATHGKPRHEQATAYERIGRIGTAEGTGFLAGGSETFDNYTRWTCIWPLIHNESKTVRRALIGLVSGRRRAQRINAAVALGGPGGAGAAPPDPDAVDALIAACKDPAESVRIAAADSLGLIGDPRAAPALIEALQHDKSVRVAHHALRALRGRELASVPEVKTALGQVSKTRRDCGVPELSTSSGRGGLSLMDQPANSFVVRCFARDYDDLSLPNLSYESALAADDAGGIVQWGSHGRRYDSPQTCLTWLFDVKAGTWRRPTPKQEPPGICMTRGIVCDTARGLVMATRVPTGMGGHGYVMYLRKFAAFSVPWVFDVATAEWYAMRPAPHPGSAGYVASCFDWRNDAMLMMKNGMQVYDTHANAWTSPAPEPAPGGIGSGPPNAYDPVTGRLVVIGAHERGQATTWAYDLATNTWTDLKPSDPPPALGDAPMVYDSANDVMLAFHRSGGGTSVHVYHLRENRWESLPAANPSPDYALFDAAYDPVNNVTVFCGGEDASCSGEPCVRETWTYRYKAAPAGKPRPALTLDLGISQDGAVALSWNTVDDAQGYHVYRGTGEHPWTAEFEKLAEQPSAATAFAETDKLGAEAHYYRVIAVGADGEEVGCSNLARTQPLPVREVNAARAADGGVSLSWRPSAGPAVVGYNIYRAPIDQIDFWTEHFDPAKVGEFVKLNGKPIADTRFTDRPDDAAGPATETSWAPLYAYVVRAINVLGVESGPSPATPSIAGPPGPVVVVPDERGASLVVAGPSGSAPLAGHYLYRLDCYRGDLFFRTRGAPQAGTVFVDDETWPAGDRRAYYVIPVDELGQLGVSSSPGWGHDMP